MSHAEGADSPGGPGPLRAAVVTCSDSVAAGRAQDSSGPLVHELLAALGHRPDPVVVVPDEASAIGVAVAAAIGAGADIVVTTGGTGAGPRDVTPQALRALGLVELPGLGEAMRAASRARHPTTDLSRALGGILGGAVVLALPGSPGGVRDGLATVGPLLPHAVAMAGGQDHRQEPSPPGAGGTMAEHLRWPVGRVGAPGPALVTVAPLDAAALAAQVGRDAAGAVVTFCGVVRDHDHGRTVSALHYEAHPDAGKLLASIVAAAHERPGVLSAVAAHRIGDLEVGDLAFVAAVGAAHRAEAFQACTWLVDEVKARVPIWKRQVFGDGSHEWVNSP